MFLRLCALLLAVTLTPCIEAGGPSPEELVKDLMSVWENGDTERLETILSPTVVYEDIPNGRTLEGLDAARAYVSHVHTWASEIQIEVTHVFGNQTEAAAEWVMTGIQSAPIPGRVPVATLRPIKIRGVTLIRVENGKIIRAADSLDALGFILQLGAFVDLPGGVRIPPDQTH